MAKNARHAKVTTIQRKQKNAKVAITGKKTKVKIAEKTRNGKN